MREKLFDPSQGYKPDMYGNKIIAIIHSLLGSKHLDFFKHWRKE